jgi:hypothetical protein
MMPPNDSCFFLFEAVSRKDIRKGLKEVMFFGSNSSVQKLVWVLQTLCKEPFFKGYG